MAVKGGMDLEHALAAITIRPAEIAGIADRVGALTPGKDADIVVTSGHPIHLLSQVQAVFIAGQRVAGQAL
jgi:imidazolonepropionase-like amidohydrolase